MDLDLALGAQYKVDDSSSIKGKVHTHTHTSCTMYIYMHGIC